MTSIALCIPTYQRHECVNEFLCEYAGYYQKYGIDIYYYDSSPDDLTFSIVMNSVKQIRIYTMSVCLWNCIPMQKFIRFSNNMV